MPAIDAGYINAGYIVYITREGWCVRCACLSRPSGRVGSNDPLSLSSTESSPTSHAKLQRPSNPNRFPLRNQSLPDVRHRGDRNPDRNQNRSFNRCPTCATVAMGTQFGTRIERQIACQLEPKIDTEIDPKSMQNRSPKGQNDSQISPWGAQTTQEGPRRVFKSLLGRSWGSLWRSWGILGRLLGSLGTPPGSTKVAKENPQTPQRPQNRPQNVCQDRKADQPGSETIFDMIFA